MKILTVGFIAMVTALSYSQSNYQVADLESIATSYIKAYEMLDSQKLAAFYSDESEFNDHTYQSILRVIQGDKYTASKPIVGRQAITKMIDGVAATMKDLKFEVVKKIFTGEHALFVMRASATAIQGDGKPDLKGEVSMVTVVQVRDGKVISHLDYVDYADYFRQRDAQLAETN